MNIRKKWIAMVLAFAMAVSPLPGAAVRAESGESAGEEIVVLETAEEAEADAESLGEVEVQAGETADEELDAAVEVRAARYSYTWFYVSIVNNTDVEIGTEGEEENLGKRLVEKYNKDIPIKCKCRDLNDESSEFLAEVYPSVSDNKDETFSANCVEEGKITFVADFSPQVGGMHSFIVTLPIDPNVHTTLEYEAEENGKCEESGHVAGYTCQGCGKHFEDEEATKIIEDQDWIKEALGHDWGEWKTTCPTCEVQGSITRTCQRDEKHEEKIVLPVDPNAHKLKVTLAKNATCTENGNIEYYTCQECGKCFLDPAGETEIDKDIDKDKWFISAKGHQLTKIDAKEATCEEAGHAAGYTCEVCRKHFAEDQKTEITEDEWLISAKGHQLTKIDAKEATCEEAGHAAGYTCEVCRKHFAEDQKTEITEDKWIIPAKGHDWTEWEVVKQPTCNAKGEIVRTCKRDASHEERKELVENPKAHKLTVTLAEDATCTEVGNIEYYTCQECGKYFSDPGTETEIAKDSWIIPAQGHDWTEWEVTKTPTCTKKGERIRTCQRDASHVEKEELPEDPKAHTLVSMAAKAPTCTENGNSAYYTCQECGKHFSDPGAENEIAKESWIIKATGHKLTKTAAKAATCTAVGNSEYYTCKECGKYFADANGKKEIKKDSWVIKAKGHQIREKEIKPTASKEGSLVRSCEACGYVQEQYTLPRTALKLIMGKSKKTISKAEGCTFAVPKSAKKYLAVAKTGKITAVKKPELYKDVKKIVPVKVKVGGKSYTVKVKLDIPAPNIKIMKKPVTIGGKSSYRYTFDYDLAGATKIRVRIKEISSRNSELDRYISKAKSDKLSYINFLTETVKKMGDKVTFEITAYYGKRVSKVRKIVVR